MARKKTTGTKMSARKRRTANRRIRRKAVRRERTTIRNRKNQNIAMGIIAILLFLAFVYFLY